MKTALVTVLALAALALGACGGSSDTSSSTTAGASGVSGAQGATANAEMTASDFVNAPIPDQLKAVDDAVKQTPECQGVDASPGGDFQVNVAIDAASADPSTPISQVVADNCGSGN